MKGILEGRVELLGEVGCVGFGFVVVNSVAMCLGRPLLPSAVQPLLQPHLGAMCLDLVLFLVTETTPFSNQNLKKSIKLCMQSVYSVAAFILLRSA